MTITQGHACTIKHSVHNVQKILKEIKDRVKIPYRKGHTYWMLSWVRTRLSDICWITAGIDVPTKNGTKQLSDILFGKELTQLTKMGNNELMRNIVRFTAKWLRMTNVLRDTIDAMALSETSHNLQAEIEAALELPAPGKANSYDTTVVLVNSTIISPPRKPVAHRKRFE